MANELDIYESGGELAPYSPDQPLAPVYDDWGDEPDYLTEPHVEPEQYQQQQEYLAQLEGAFLSDMLRLGHDRRLINDTSRLFRDCVDNPPENVRKQHNYQCYQYAADPVFNHICNHLHRLNAPQSYIQTLAWWAGELEKRLGVKVAGQQSPVAAKNQEYTDREWAEIIRRNQIARDRTEDILRDKWGSSYEQNIAATNDFLNSLPAHERDHFDQITATGIHALNDAGVITRLFQMATGQNSLPSGGALATEIASIEHIMRVDRKRYNSDLRMQARLRTLYSIRDGE